MARCCALIKIILIRKTAGIRIGIHLGVEPVAELEADVGISI